MVKPAVEGARRLLAAAIVCAPLSAPLAQELPLVLEPLWGSPLHCPAQIERINQSLAGPSPDGLLAAGREVEAGECVARSPTRAAQYYTWAARIGSVEAARHMARLSGQGLGVAQSYGAAGSWLAGMSDSDPAVEPWTYSVGYAYTLIASALERVRFPREGWPAGLEITLVVKAAARQPGMLRWGFTADATPQARALGGALALAIDAAAAQAFPPLAPPNPKFVVDASVRQPLTVRRVGEDRFVVTEQDPILQ